MILQKPTFNGILLAILVIIICFAGCIQSTDVGDHSSSEKDTSVEVTDSLGNTVILPHPANRIVCQNAYATRILILLGEGDKIIGVPQSQFEDPEFKKDLPNAQSIGDWTNPDIEAILATKPDCIIVYPFFRPHNYDKVISELTRANISVLHFDFYKISTLPSEVRTLGKIVGNERVSEEFAHYIEEYTTLIQTRISNNSGQAQIRVYSELYSDYSIQGAKSGGDELFTFLRVKNLGGEFPMSSKVSPEWVIEQNPDFIIRFASSTDNSTSAQGIYNSILTRPGYNTLSAVKNRKFYVVSGNSAFGPHGIIGTLQIAKILYPEKFSDIDLDTVLKDYRKKFPLANPPDELLLQYPDPEYSVR